ncbi:MAG TPA: hypothetical protein VKE69_08130, partial [Planctomycetota bacterium]|nr:hypothetical protein [Planctomycetota bacterium]
QTGSFQVIWETANFPDAIRLVCGVIVEVAATPSYGYVPPTPACGSVLHVIAGQTIEFDVKVVDTDPTHVLALAAIDQPPGSTFTPPLPIVVFGNGIDPPTITSHFSWTPGLDQTGSFQVVWDAANFPPAIRLFCGVTIIVEPPPPFGYTPPTPSCGSVIHTTPGQTVEFDIKLVDSDPTHVIALEAIQQPAGSTFTPPLPIVVFGNGVDAPTITTHFKWTPAPDQTGSFQVIWDAANFPPAIRLFCSVTIEVASAATICSATQAGWGAPPSGTNTGMMLRNNFASVYPSGVEIGMPGAGGSSAKFTSSDAIEKFLPAAGAAGVLSGDFVDPTGATGAGAFAGQVLALQLNVDFSDAGLPPNDVALGSLTLKATGIPGLDGQTIAQVLASAKQTLGGGGPSYGLSTSDLNDIVTKLNEGFDGCHADDWSRAHLY